MSKLTSLFRAVCGLSGPSTQDGRPLPQSVRGWRAIVVVHDRRLSAGIFALRRRKSAKLYRIVAWRTYRAKNGKEQASATLYRDELDPVARLIQQCAERMPND